MERQRAAARDGSLARRSDGATPFACRGAEGEVASCRALTALVRLDTWPYAIGSPFGGGSTLHPESKRIFARHPRLTMALVVATFVAAGHAWSLDAGLFLDDHAHRAQLSRSGWSHSDAVKASRLGIVGEVMGLWSGRWAGLSFYRPIAFWTLKLEYVVARWHPVPMHLFSLAWHWLCAMLLGQLAWLCFGRWFWAGVAAAFFAVHPAHVATTHWIACQTELMVAAYLLLAVLAYARYSQWPTPIFARTRGFEQAPTRRSGVGWLLLAGLFFAMALGCRENAITFPAIMFVGDVVLRPARWRGRVGAYVLFGAIVGGYILLRAAALEGLSLPARPYLVPPTDPDFPRFVADKFVYSMLGLFAYVPVLPIGGLAYFREHPGAFYGGFAGLVAGWLGLAVAFRQQRGLLLAAGWLVLAIAPLLPVFTSPHHLYLPSLGAVLIMSSVLAKVGGGFVEPARRLPLARTLIVSLVLGLHAIGLTLCCWSFGWVYRAGTAVEDVLIADVLEHGRPLKEGDRLFFINLPLIAYYIIPAIKAETGLSDLNGTVLTFCPSLMRMEARSHVERTAANRLTVRVDDDRYLRGSSGRVLLEAMGLPTELPAGTTIEARSERDELRQVDVLEADREGIRALAFTFKRPLADPSYHFYRGSRQRLAYPIDFRE